MKKFLPIGSVVLLKDSTKRLMIIGVKQIQEDGTEWDYSACLFPEGMIDSKEFYVFNADDIDVLFFIGLQDSESLAFLQALEEMDEMDEISGKDEESEEEEAPTPQPFVAKTPVAEPEPEPIIAVNQPPAPPPIIPQPKPAPPPVKPRPAAPATQAGVNRCPNCGYTLSAGAKFCKECGTRI